MSSRTKSARDVKTNHNDVSAHSRTTTKKTINASSITNTSRCTRAARKQQRGGSISARLEHVRSAPTALEILDCATVDSSTTHSLLWTPKRPYAVAAAVPPRHLCVCVRACCLRASAYRAGRLWGVDREQRIVLNASSTYRHSDI